MANCEGITITLGNATNICNSPIITRSISNTGVDTTVVDGGTPITVSWATVITSFTAVTGCISNAATTMVNDGGTIKKATIRQIANSRKTNSGSGITVTDETHIFSTGGTVILPSTGLCQDVSISVTPCDASPTTISAGGTVKIDNYTTYSMKLLSFHTIVLRWDSVTSSYRVISEFLKENITSLIISVRNVTSQNILINTEQGTPYNINWGDTTSNNNVTNNTGLTHTYSPAFTGNITITAGCSFSVVTIQSTDFGAVFQNIGDIPPTVTNYTVGGSNTVTGDISRLPAKLTNFTVTGQNTVTGNIAFLPSTLLVLTNTGSNTLSGNIASLPPKIQTINLQGLNTVSGSVALLPRTLLSLTLVGSNTVSGSISFLPPTMTTFNIQGSNTVSGDIGLLPSTLTVFNCEGSNTISGSINTLPAGLVTIGCGGNNTISGNIANLPSTLTSFSIRGSNTTTGSIGSLPTGLLNYSNNGTGNTSSGNLANLPPNLTTYSNSGLNTVTGSINSLPATVTIFENQGLNTVNSYTAGKVFSNNMLRFIHLPASGSGLTSAMVDALLIDLAPLTWGSGTKILNLAGNNAARTSASNTAVTTLQGKGVTVTTN